MRGWGCWLVFGSLPQGRGGRLCGSWGCGLFVTLTPALSLKGEGVGWLRFEGVIHPAKNLTCRSAAAQLWEPSFLIPMPSTLARRA